MNRLWQMLKSTIPFFLKRFPYQALNSICFSSEALRLSHFFFFLIRKARLNLSCLKGKNGSTCPQTLAQSQLSARGFSHRAHRPVIGTLPPSPWVTQLLNEREGGKGAGRSPLKVGSGGGR